MHDSKAGSTGDTLSTSLFYTLCKGMIGRLVNSNRFFPWHSLKIVSSIRVIRGTNQ
jgi:hypothetical protein